MYTGALAEFSAYLTHVRGYSTHTVAAYLRDVSVYISYCQNGANWDQISQILASQYSVVSIRRKRSAMMTYWRFLHQRGELKEVPILPSLSAYYRPIPHYLSQSEWGGLWSALAGVSQRNRLVVGITYSAGLRVGEVAKLTWDCINVSASTIRVLGKGGAERMVPVRRELLLELQQYWQSMHQKRVKRGWLIRPVSSRLIQYIIQDALGVCQLNRVVSAHSLRHTAAVHLLNSGATLVDVQQFLGHQSIQTTRHYAKTTRQREKQEAMQCHPRW